MNDKTNQEDMSEEEFISDLHGLAMEHSGDPKGLIARGFKELAVPIHNWLRDELERGRQEGKHDAEVLLLGQTSLTLIYLFYMSEFVKRGCEENVAQLMKAQFARDVDDGFASHIAVSEAKEAING